MKIPLKNRMTLLIRIVFGISPSKYTHTHTHTHTSLQNAVIIEEMLK